MSSDEWNEYYEVHYCDRSHCDGGREEEEEEEEN
jgi:hypothetical protein